MNGNFSDDVVRHGSKYINNDRFGQRLCHAV